jgi:hypothetical protein
MQKWYWVFLFVWVCTGLPFSVGWLGSDLSWPTADTALPWMVGWLIVFAPILLLPFGRKA